MNLYIVEFPYTVFNENVIIFLFVGIFVKIFVFFFMLKTIPRSPLPEITTAFLGSLGHTTPKT